MTAPRFTVVLIDGRRLDAVDVEHLPGSWLRAVTIRTRVEHHAAENLGHRVFDRLVTRRFPPTAVREVVEHAAEFEHRDLADPLARLDHSIEGAGFP